MGIRGLTGYITKNPREFLEFYELRDTYLVIDGLNIYYALYRDADKHLGAMGPRYDVFSEAIKDFFEALLKREIRPIVVLDSLEALNKEKCIQMFRDKLERFSPGTDCQLPHLVRDVFLSILTNLKIKFVQTIAEADETMVALAKALDCPILSADGDFFLQGTKFVPFSLLNQTPKAINGSAEKYFLHCQFYDVIKFCRNFVTNRKCLEESLLPLALPILGNKNGRSYLDDNIMAPFLEKLERDYRAQTTHYHHKKIEKTFKWLSQYSSMTEAIVSIIICIRTDHREKILDDIRTFISEVGIGSPLAVQSLDLPEDVTTRILNENSKKVLKIQESVESVKRWMGLRVDGDDEKGHYFTEKELVTMFPEWMIDDLLRGKVRSIPFELLMFSIAILKPLTEDASQPPTGFASLPILEKIYSIISSLGKEDESLLKIYYTRGKEVVEKDRLIPTSSFDLRNIDSFEESEKKLVITKALGIDEFNRLNELPNCWRLYVATMIFWLKQDVEPKKKKAHVFAVILAMLHGKVDDEIGVIRSMQTFEEKFGGAYRDIIVRPGTMSRLMEGLSLRETMRLISKDECIAAAPFFIMHSSTSTQEFYFLKGDWRKVVHTFTQFHSCLKNAIILNSILRYPYAEVPLHRTYNGLLFYKLFKDFEGLDDIDGYLRGQLEHSPGILESFFALRDIVLSLLGEESWKGF